MSVQLGLGIFASALFIAVLVFFHTMWARDRRENEACKRQLLNNVKGEAR